MKQDAVFLGSDSPTMYEYEENELKRYLVEIEPRKRAIREKLEDLRQKDED